LCLIKIAD